MEVAKNALRTKGQTNVITLFCCYAYKDEKLKNELEKHLAILKRQGLVFEWSNRKIEPSTDWSQSIDAHLNTADIILLLISPDLLSSNYWDSVGMQRVIEDQKAGKVHVVPIFLRPVEWEGVPFSQLQILPEEGKPVALWENRDSAFCSIARGVRRVIEAHQHKEEITRKSRSRNIFNEINAKINYYEIVTKMPYQIINTTEAINIFYHLLQPDNKKRMFRIIGNANMGKSHLLNQVFRPLAHDIYHMNCIALDLRNPSHTVLDILCMVRSQIDDNILDEENWKLFFSTDRLPKNSLLTSHVMKELKKLDKPVLFLIDSVEGAKKTTSAWLTEIFLTTLVSSLNQVRIVIAGRLLPEVYGSCAELSIPQPPSPPYQLYPVKDEEAYIDYCERINADLVEQSIRDFAYACDYTPGIFATLIHAKFLPREDKNE